MPAHPASEETKAFSGIHVASAFTIKKYCFSLSASLFWYGVCPHQKSSSFTVTEAIEQLFYTSSGFKKTRRMSDFLQNIFSPPCLVSPHISTTDTYAVSLSLCFSHPLPVSFSSSSGTLSHSSLHLPSSGERPAESGAADGEQRIGCNRRRAQRLSGRHGCWFGLTSQWQHGSRQWVPPLPHTHPHATTNKQRHSWWATYILCLLSDILDW